MSQIVDETHRGGKAKDEVLVESVALRDQSDASGSCFATWYFQAPRIRPGRF